MAHTAALLRKKSSFDKSLLRGYNSDTTEALAGLYGEGFVVIDASSESATEAAGFEIIDGRRVQCAVNLAEVIFHANGEPLAEISDAVKSAMKDSLVINRPYKVGDQPGISGAIGQLETVAAPEVEHTQYRIYAANGDLVLARSGIVTPGEKKPSDVIWHESIADAPLGGSVEVAREAYAHLQQIMGVSGQEIAVAFDVVDDGLVSVTKEPARSSGKGVRYVVAEAMAMHALATRKSA